jgi:L-ascorbate metabolism protein UlaG (beta-lactamase superfamily)
MTMSVTDLRHGERGIDHPLTVRVHYLGGPTAVLKMGGVRLITDPTFDAPGDYVGGDLMLTKTIGPALSPEELDPVDVVLLSHDQHLDNLDHCGRAYLAKVPRVVSTASARDRLGKGVEALSHLEADRSGPPQW